MKSDALKCAVVTFGCRVNQADSLLVEDGLRARATAVPPEQADLVVVNTCSVTASADQSARQIIRRIARSNPSVRVVVTGCYATRRRTKYPCCQTSSASLQMAKKTPWCPTSPRMSGSRPRNGSATATVHVAARSSPGPQAEQPLHCVQTGCEEQCSYCIIPQTRGHSRSRPLGQVIDDVHCAITAGYKEIAITGVHLGSYGRDLHDGSVARIWSLRLRRSMTTCCSESALWSRWTAPMTSSRSSRPHRGLRRIFTCRCKMALTKCCG